MRGMITYLAPLWLAKQYAVMDWSKFITSWARAIKALTAPNDLSAPQKARLMSDMQNLEQGRDYIYLPNGAMLSAITVPSQNGDAVGSFIEAIDKQFSVAILGMDVDADGGAYNAVGTVYEGIVLGTVRDDIASVNESFLRPAVRAMTQRLFGSRSLAPRVTVSAKSIQYKDLHALALNNQQATNQIQQAACPAPHPVSATASGVESLPTPVDVQPQVVAQSKN